MMDYIEQERAREAKDRADAHAKYRRLTKLLASSPLSKQQAGELTTTRQSLGVDLDTVERDRKIFEREAKLTGDAAGIEADQAELQTEMERGRVLGAEREKVLSDLARR
jgi:hypothetical protein